MVARRTRRATRAEVAKSTQDQEVREAEEPASDSGQRSNRSGESRQHAITDFTLGEISPLAQGRVEHAIARRTVKSGRNCQVRPQGPISNRMGFEHFDNAVRLDSPTEDAHMVPFERSDGSSDMLVFAEDELTGNSYMRSFNRDSDTGVISWNEGDMITVIDNIVSLGAGLDTRVSIAGAVPEWSVRYEDFYPYDHQDIKITGLTGMDELEGLWVTARHVVIDSHEFDQGIDIEGVISSTSAHGIVQGVCRLVSTAATKVLRHRRMESAIFSIVSMSASTARLNMYSNWDRAQVPFTEAMWEDYEGFGDTFIVEMLSTTDFDLEIDSFGFVPYVTGGTAVCRDEVLCGETLEEIKATHSEQSGRLRHFVNADIRPFEIIRRKASETTVVGPPPTMAKFRSIYEYLPSLMRPRYINTYGHSPVTVPEVSNLIATSPNPGSTFTYAYCVTVKLTTDGQEPVPADRGTTEGYSRYVVIRKANTITTDNIALTWDAISSTLYTVHSYLVYRYNPEANEFWYIGFSFSAAYVDSVVTPWAGLGAETPGAGNPQDQVAFTRAPAIAVEAFRAPEDYPGGLTFASQRLIMGATNNEPDATWASEIAEFSDFRKTEPSLNVITGSSAFKVRAWAKSVSVIQSYAPLNDVIILTDRAELALAAGADGVLSAASVSLPIQSHNGSNRKLQPLVVDNAVLYAQEKGRVIRDIRAGTNASTSLDYQGRELSVLVEHILNSREVVSWSWASSPDSFIFGVLDNGDAFMMTYSTEHDTVAFTSQDTTGFFKGTATLDEDDENGVYVLVSRPVGFETGSLPNQLMIERMRARTDVADVELAFHVDSGVRIVQAAIPEVLKFIDWFGVWHINFAGAAAAYDDVVVDIRGFNMSGNKDGRYKLTHFGIDQYELLDADTDDPIVLDYDPLDLPENFTFREPVNTVALLPHLAGQEVSIVSNGNYGAYTVSEGGIVVGALELASIFTIGRPYRSTVQTLSAGVSARAGYLGQRFFGRRKSVQQLTLRMYQTRGIKVGSSENELRELLWRTNENYYEATRLFTGDKKTPVKGMFDLDGSVVVVQDEPFPFTITALFPDLKVGDL